MAKSKSRARHFVDTVDGLPKGKDSQNVLLRCPSKFCADYDPEEDIAPSGSDLEDSDENELDGTEHYADVR